MPRPIVITGSPEQQRPDERVAYEVTLADSYTSPASPVCTLYSIVAGTETDVTATNLSGSPSIVGQAFTSPLVIGLTAGTTYRLEFQFVSGGSRFEPYLMIEGRA